MNEHGEFKQMLDYIREDIKAMRDEFRDELKSLREEVRGDLKEIREQTQTMSNTLAIHTKDDHQNFDKQSEQLTVIDSRLAIVEKQTVRTDTKIETTEGVKKSIGDRLLSVAAVVISLLAMIAIWLKK